LIILTTNWRQKVKKKNSAKERREKERGRLREEERRGERKRERRERKREVYVSLFFTQDFLSAFSAFASRAE